MTASSQMKTRMMCWAVGWLCVLTTGQTQAASQSNGDAWEGIAAGFRATAKRYEAQKIALIENGSVVVDPAGMPESPGSRNPALPGKGWVFYDSVEGQPCLMRFALPPKSEDIRCGPQSGSSESPTWFSTVGETFDWSAAFLMPIRKLYTKGYPIKEHYNDVLFMIMNNESFEQRLLGSPQVGAIEDSLFANTPMFPTSIHKGSGPFVPVIIKNNGGTLLLIARVNTWDLPIDYKGRVVGPRYYSSCIYSIHGNTKRSAEALSCFLNIGKRYRNKYVDDYLKVLDSIRMD